LKPYRPDTSADNSKAGGEEVVVDAADVGSVEDVLNPASDLAENADEAEDDAAG